MLPLSVDHSSLQASGDETSLSLPSSLFVRIFAWAILSLQLCGYLQDPGNHQLHLRLQFGTKRKPLRGSKMMKQTCDVLLHKARCLAVLYSCVPTEYNAVFREQSIPDYPSTHIYVIFRSHPCDHITSPLSATAVCTCGICVVSWQPSSGARIRFEPIKYFNVASWRKS